MTTENNQKSEAENQNVEGETTGSEQDKVTFDANQQKKVNSLVAEEKRKGENNVKLAKTQYEQQLKDQTDLIKNYETQLQKIVDSQISSLDEGTKKLLTKLSILDQLEWLAENGQKFEKKTIPQTPQSQQQKSQENKRRIPVGGGNW